MFESSMMRGDYILALAIAQKWHAELDWQVVSRVTRDYANPGDMYYQRLLPHVQQGFASPAVCALRHAAHSAFSNVGGNTHSE